MTSTAAVAAGVPPPEFAERPGTDGTPGGSGRPGVGLRAAVRDELRRRIIDGRLPPGTRLVERHLATELDVSRVPVREALRDLVAEGYAVTRPTRGIAVRSYPDAEVDELFEIRSALEAVLVDRAAAGLPKDRLNLLRDSLLPARTALAGGDIPAAISANARFHEVLEEVAAGPLLRGLLAGIRDRMRWLLQQHGDPAGIAAEHEALVAAIAAADRSQARRLLRQHLTTSRAALSDRRLA